MGYEDRGKRIVIVKHGGKWEGEDLGKYGLWNALMTAKKLTGSFTLNSLPLVVSSSLSAAKMTAEIIARRLKCDHQIIEQLGFENKKHDSDIIKQAALLVMRSQRRVKSNNLVVVTEEGTSIGLSNYFIKTKKINQALLTSPVEQGENFIFMELDSGWVFRRSCPELQPRRNQIDYLEKWEIQVIASL